MEYDCPRRPSMDHQDHVHHHRPTIIITNTNRGYTKLIDRTGARINIDLFIQSLTLGREVIISLHRSKKGCFRATPDLRMPVP